MAAIAAALVLGTLLSGSAQAADDSWTSLYAGTPYEGSGWSVCPLPITVSVDARTLKPDARKKAKAALVAALQRWNRPKIVRFEYVGPIPVNFDPATGVTTPTDGVARDRHVYMAVVKAGKAPSRETAVVGLAGPLRVDPATQIILEGSGAFRAQYVEQASRKRVTELFAHELGHVFGLGHSSSEKDVMYPILQGLGDLGSGDIAGAYALLKPCPAPTPAPEPAQPEPVPAG